MLWELLYNKKNNLTPEERLYIPIYKQTIKKTTEQIY